MRPLYTGIAHVVQTIEECLAKERFLPALVLLYSTIDVVASLESGKNADTQKDFTTWVERYLLKKTASLACTALELWGARCGILHTFTPESRTSRQARGRMVVYAYGDARTANTAAIAAMSQRGCCIVYVRELMDGFRDGLADYLEEVLHDPEREKRLATAVEMWFDKVPTP